MQEDTICAPASAPVNSPIAVVRISGPGTLGVINTIFSRPHEIRPRYAVYGSITSEHGTVDDVVLVYYESPRSFTGEDMADIFCHGNPIILRKIMKLIIGHGARMAEPGEFSRRSFLNGKIDLTEAEAINHIITGRSEWEVSSAVKQMHGALRSIVNDVRERIIRLKADIEAGIDFSEEDIEFVTNDEALRQTGEIRKQAEDILKRCRIGQKVSHGIDVPIVGRPNVGKSSILNLILNTERAIVSDIPGTTRDLINELVQFAGMGINLIDTAGFTETECEIEKRGIELSSRKIETASIVIMVIDASAGVTDDDMDILREIGDKPRVILANKIDICDRRNMGKIESAAGEKVIPFSARTGEGLSELEQAVGNFVRTEFVEVENSFVADMRVVNILESAISSIDDCERVIADKEAREIVAVELQNLIDHLSEITGEISPDDVLNSIFSRFCIGK